MKPVTEVVGVPGMDQEARSGFVAGGTPEDPGAATGTNNK